MYAVVQGRVAVTIGGRVVERLGPGGAFGEAALVDPSPRLASAVAETDCELQPITAPGISHAGEAEPAVRPAGAGLARERLRFLTERLK